MKITSESVEDALPIAEYPTNNQIISTDSQKSSTSPKIPNDFLTSPSLSGDIAFADLNLDDFTTANSGGEPNLALNAGELFTPPYNNPIAWVG